MHEELAAQRLLVEEGHRIRSSFSEQGKEAKAEKQQLLISLGPQRDELSSRKEELRVSEQLLWPWMTIVVAEWLWHIIALFPFECCSA